MSDNFSVSLAIPCYNAEIFIEKVIGSIDKQSRRPDEILIIDDGSNDNTRNLVGQFSHVRLIVHESNRGIAAARNTAIQYSQCDIIVFLDADAIASPNYIEEILIPFSQENIAGVNGRAIECIQNNIYDKWRKEVLFQEWGDVHLNEVFFLFGMCAAYRKVILEEVNGFNNLFRISGEDMDISYRIRKKGYRLAYNPHALVYHQRCDNDHTIKKMAFRHCFWGFLAQNKNRCYQNKMPLWRSAFIFIRQVCYDGILKGNLDFTLLSFQLHLIMCKAWVAARKTEIPKLENNHDYEELKKYEWEGHRGK